MTLSNQTESPLKIVFEGCIATGYAAPSRTLLRWGGESAVLTNNKTCSPFSQALTLAPGKNSLSIHSDAARLPTAQTDSRYIVFGVFDWKVRDPNAILPTPEERSDHCNTRLREMFESNSEMAFPVPSIHPRITGVGALGVPVLEKSFSGIRPASS